MNKILYLLKLKINPLHYMRIDLLKVVSWVLIFILAIEGFIPWWFVVASMLMSMEGLTYIGKYYRRS